MTIKWPRALPVLCCWIILAGLVSSGWTEALNHDDAFDILLDFSPESTDETPPDTWLDLSGNLKFSSSSQFAADPPDPGKTDFRGINELKSSLFLRSDMTVSQAFTARVDATAFYNGIYRIRGQGHYTDQTLDTYESDLELMNCYIEGQVSHRMDIKLGRQVVAWGKSDSFRITDVLNPVDYQEPGRKDLSESKLPVLMAKLDVYTGPFNLSVIGSFEHRWNRYPVFGSMFYPFDFPISDEDGTSPSFSDMDYALALGTSFAGSDLSVYMADYMDTTPYMKTAFPLPVFTLEHARVKMIGADINHAWKNWLFKAEAAFFSGIRFSDYLDPPFNLVHLSNQTFDTTQVLCGIEYMGFKDTYLSLEATNTRINGYDNSLERSGISKNNPRLAFKLIRTCLNGAATITLQSKFSGQNSQDGAVHKMEMSYNLSDDLTVSGGVLWFEAGKNFIYQTIGDKDMVFIDLSYYF